MGKNIKRIVLVLSLMVLGIVVGNIAITQIINPVSYTIEKIKCDKDFMIYDTIKMVDDQYNKRIEENSMKPIYISYNGKLPSENENDYMTFCYYFNAKNRSIFKDYTVNATLKDMNYSDRVLFAYDTTSLYTPQLPKKGEISLRCELFVYVAGMSEEEIKSLASSIEFVLLAQNGKTIKSKEIVCDKKIDVIEVVGE